MVEKVTRVEAANGGGNFGPGLIIGVIVTVLIILGVVLVLGRGFFNGGGGAGVPVYDDVNGRNEIDVPSRIDLNIDMPRGAGELVPDENMNPVE
jgi:hypothetical protein